jgi:hypothetical protein
MPFTVERVGGGDSLVKSWFVHKIAEHYSSLVDWLVLPMLLCKQVAVIWKFLKFDMDESFFEFR